MECTASGETTPQSSAPQHHSPAGFLYAPRLIQTSWANAAEVQSNRASTSSEQRKFRDIGGLLVVARRGVTKFLCSSFSLRDGFQVFARRGGFDSPTCDRL